MLIANINPSTTKRINKMSELTGDLTRLAASMAKGRHLGKLQVISEYQQTIKGTKLGRMIEEVEYRQRLDAIFLKRVIAHITKLENKEV